MEQKDQEQNPPSKFYQNQPTTIEIKKPVYQWFAKEKLNLSTSPGTDKLPSTPYGTPC